MKVKHKATQGNGWSESTIDQDGTIYYRDFEPVDDVLRENAFLRSLAPNAQQWAGNSGRRVARLSPLMAAELSKQGILDDPARLRKWLNDPANKKWRTIEGKV